MKIENILLKAIIDTIKKLYAAHPEQSMLTLRKTNKEFEGHYTLVTFPLQRLSRKKPEETAEEIGADLIQHHSDLIAEYSVVKGFLNLTISSSVWIDLLNSINRKSDFGFTAANDNSPLYMVEYSSPNTNKPLHLGHVRNNLLGHALSEVLKANGKKVVKTNIVNDRGVHICKSMLAWQKWGAGETPESSAKKGDHLIGDYYVLFDQKYKEEIAGFRTMGMTDEEAEESSLLMKEVYEMLRRWEANDPATVDLWKKMNSWVYTGFDETYHKLGISFDKIYYESDTYLAGREEVLRGLKEGLFYQKEDGSIWADLTSYGLDHKLLLRADGTSVYITQDIGTAKLRFDDYPIDKMIYVVGNEQNYHFQVLSILLDILGFNFGKELMHFSYGMVELPEGRMKSREGTVVDADDLMAEMINAAGDISAELGKVDEETPGEMEYISNIVGMGALKYFILKVDPKKNMTFDPRESIDFNGNTGPFIQYTHARIQSVLRKADKLGILIGDNINNLTTVSKKEEGLVQLLAEFEAIIKQAGSEYNVSLIANYSYELAKEYNQFYHDHTILREENIALRNFRLILSKNIALTIKKAMSLFGIEVPDRM